MASAREDNGDRPARILLLGMRRSGKTSILKVVFHKMSPHETLFIDSTTKIQKNDVSNSPFVRFQVWDFPGPVDVDDASFDAPSIFGGAGAVIFVIDAQDDYADALAKLQKTISRAHEVNPRIFFEVFIHKVDGLSDDHKLENQTDMTKKVQDAIRDDPALEEDVQVSFYLTSIYDHSIYENMSKNCRMEKAFLFDVVSKVYIATDTSPVDVQSYELCSDMIDVVIDVSCIYGMRDDAEGVDGLAYDADSASVIKLNNSHVLYLREVSKYLALVCLIQESNFEKQGLIEYNVQCFKQAITEVFQVARRGRGRK